MNMKTSSFSIITLLAII